MRPTERPGTNGFNSILASTLSAIVDITVRHGKTWGRIEANQQTALANHQTVIGILTSRPRPKPVSMPKRILMGIKSVLSKHWGTILAGAVPAYRWLKPHIQLWFGL